MKDHGSKFWLGWLLVGVAGEAVAIRQDKRRDNPPPIELPTISTLTRKFCPNSAVGQVAIIIGWMTFAAWFPVHIMVGEESA